MTCLQSIILFTRSHVTPQKVPLVFRVVRTGKLYLTIELREWGAWTSNRTLIRRRTLDSQYALDVTWTDITYSGPHAADHTRDNRDIQSACSTVIRFNRSPVATDSGRDWWRLRSLLEWQIVMRNYDLRARSLSELRVIEPRRGAVCRGMSKRRSSLKTEARPRRSILKLLRSRRDVSFSWLKLSERKMRPITVTQLTICSAFFIVELYWCLSELWHCLILLDVL